MPSFDLPDVAKTDAAVEELSVKKLSDKCFIEEFFVRIEPFIRTEVMKRRLSSDQAEGIIQNVLVKLWLAARMRTIKNPSAYVRVIIVNELHALWRTRTRFARLQLDNDGELLDGHVLVNSSEGWDDPAHVFEEKETQEDLLGRTAQGLSTLPRRQQQAVVWSLAARVDDTLSVIDVLESQHISVVREEWPQDEKEVQSFRSSISIARKKLRGYIMATEQSSHDVTDKVSVAQRHKASSSSENELLPLIQGNEVVQQTEIEVYIGKLREPYKTALRLRYIERLTYQQIADELEMPLGTVKSHISRGMQMIFRRRDLGSDLYEESQQGIDIAEVLARVGILDEPYRTPVELHYAKKWTCQQIADKLGLPLGTVKSYVSRGMKMLCRHEFETSVSEASAPLPQKSSASASVQKAHQQSVWKPLPASKADSENEKSSDKLILHSS